VKNAIMIGPGRPMKCRKVRRARQLAGQRLDVVDELGAMCLSAQEARVEGARVLGDARELDTS